MRWIMDNVVLVEVLVVAFVALAAFAGGWLLGRRSPR
jgi:hypothetical protein